MFCPRALWTVRMTFFIFGNSLSGSSLLFCCITGWTTRRALRNRSSFPVVLASAMIFFLKETSFFSLQVCFVFPGMKFPFRWLTSAPHPFVLFRPLQRHDVVRDVDDFIPKLCPRPSNKVGLSLFNRLQYNVRVLKEIINNYLSPQLFMMCQFGNFAGYSSASDSLLLPSINSAGTTGARRSWKLGSRAGIGAS